MAVNNNVSYAVMSTFVCQAKSEQRDIGMVRLNRFFFCFHQYKKPARISCQPGIGKLTGNVRLHASFLLVPVLTLCALNLERHLIFFLFFCYVYKPYVQHRRMLLFHLEHHQQNVAKALRNNRTMRALTETVQPMPKAYIYIYVQMRIYVTSDIDIYIYIHIHISQLINSRPIFFYFFLSFQVIPFFLHLVLFCNFLYFL